MIDNDLATIAAKLTPAQRRTVLAGGLTYGPGYWPLRNALHDKGLLTTARNQPVLTPLGHKLRAHIEASERT
jgi:hypothetical protein